ncbi:hypothetical protein BGZ82_004538 [Podila clonocystis]|nr:hypothetical protein BGZ82_004538 [Podila clonocystis]
MSNEPKTAQSPALLKTAPPVSAIPTHRPNTQTLAAFQTSPNTTSSAIPTTQHHSKDMGSQKLHTTTTSSILIDATSKSSVASVSQIELKSVSTDTPKEKPIRKKRGQYRKTILRQQAEAIETARAAGLPIPVFPPLDSGKSSKNTEKRPEASEETERKEASSATVEHLDIRTNKPTQDRSADRAVMERELAMLQEEADEDLKKREQDTNRALMRAQVVNHLRSLRSKLDPSQIKIGHNLRIQSVDMFSEIFNEVLGEIENDNSKVLESISTGFDAKEAGSSSEHLGHMLTRSSDKPRKLPKTSFGAAEPSTPLSHELKNELYGPKQKAHQSKNDPDQPKNGLNHHHHQRRRNSEVYLEEPLHIESDDDVKPIKRARQEKSSQFIGQSWDIGPGDDETGSSSKWRNTNQPPNALDVNPQRRPLSTPQKARDINHLVRPVPRERESLQLRHRNELEQLQLLQRQEQEEFQRKQLDQLRDLQDRHSREFQEFEDANSRMFRERLASLADKRLQIMPAQHDRYHTGKERITRPQHFAVVIPITISFSFAFTLAISVSFTFTFAIPTALICEEQSFSTKHSLKKRRHSQQRVDVRHAMEVGSASAPSAIGFNQDLLSHFKQWGSDGKNGSFLDLVLSDPPDIDVDDSEAEGLLSEDLTCDFTLVKSNDVNTTPTSNAFRWYQEQQRLAQELSETPKMAPLQLQDFITSSSGTQDNGQTFGNGLSSLSLDLTQNGHSTEELIPGEDPLATYLFNLE